MKLFRFWRRNKLMTDEAKMDLAQSIGLMLKLQLVACPDDGLPSLGTPKGAKCAGYIYGFVDAALQTIGHDMADLAIGPPITYHVLRTVFPGSEQRAMDFYAIHLSADPTSELAWHLASGIQYGGQQYLDSTNKKTGVAMGLARIIVGE